MLTELLSDPRRPRTVARCCWHFPVEPFHDYWQREGCFGELLTRKHRARLADT